MVDERERAVPAGVVVQGTGGSIEADAQAMVAALQRDKMSGPYALRMSHGNVERLNPALYAELVAAGVDTPVELLLDADGRLTGWRRL